MRTRGRRFVGYRDWLMTGPRRVQARRIDVLLSSMLAFGLVLSPEDQSAPL